MQTMDRISALIVDDEHLSRKRIRRLLSVEQDIDVLGECTDGAEALRFLREQSPDLLFLDIQMPGVDGFGVVEGMPKEHAPIVVFVTAFDEYALKAFEVHAFDYLLKPFDRKRFHETVQRVRAQVGRVRGGDVSQKLYALIQDMNIKQQRTTDRIAVRSSGHVVFVKTADVDWIEAADNYVCLHSGQDNHLLRETMNAIETRLDRDKFLRIHRSTIVNLDRIKELQPWFRGDYLVILQDGTQLTLSRGYREKLQNTPLRVL